MEIPSNETIKQGVMAEMGVRFISLLHVNGFPLLRHWYVAHQRRRKPSATAKSFKAFLIE